MDAPRTALVVGATGLVGRQLVRLLLDHPGYREVKVAARRALAAAQRKLTPLVADPLDPSGLGERLAAEDVFCALGTTRSKAGSKQAFRAVDFELVVAFARAAKEHGAKRFLLVSAMGADARSRVFYNRVKGEAEDALAGMGFEVLHVFRPSLLLGHRDERRLGEGLAQATFGRLARFMVGPLRKARPVPAEVVAKAMVNAAWRIERGVRIHRNEDLFRLAE